MAESTLARAILEKLGRRPTSVLTAEAFRLSDRLRDKIRNPRFRAAFGRWRSLAADAARLPPTSEAFGLAPGLIDNSCLLRIESHEPEAASFRVLSAGASLSERLGQDFTGDLISAADHDLLGSMHSAYRRALKGAAYFDYARFPLSRDTMVLFERLILPLSDDGERVTHLFGLITFGAIGSNRQEKARG